MTRKHKRQLKDDKETEDLEETPNKPLKLVLKVGSQGTPIPSPGGSAADENDSIDKKHRHKRRKKNKEKKDKKRREEDAESDIDEDNGPNNDSTLKLSEPEESDTYHDDSIVIKPEPTTMVTEMSTPSRSLRERKTDGEKTVLNYLLDYLHKILSRKDVNGFFQFPVTDQIAPRYSEIISNPMDFSTIRKKLDQSQYTSVSEYKYDFRLMLENCMAYNHPDTIFHKEAQRLLTIGLKQLSKEKLVSLKRSLPNLVDITDEELGLKDDSGDESISCVEYKKPRKGQMSAYEAIVDDESPEDILSQVQAAARLAAAEFKQKNGNGRTGYLKKKRDGSTYLNILNPENSGIVSETERVVNIGGLMEKLKTGTGNLAGFREDKRNKAIPLSYLTYGPFSSYAPIYDSTTANLSKEESNLLLSTYGDEAGLQYSKSIQNFVENSGDYAIQMVDNLIEILTAGKHSKTKQYFTQKENLSSQKEERQKELTPNKEVNEEYDIESLKSLSKLGIDMSFLETMDKSVPNEEGSKEVQEQLNRTSELLTNLNNSQHQRLSNHPPPHLALVPGPSDKECNIAERLTKGLTGLTKQVNPSNLTNAAILRSAMGVVPSRLQTSNSGEGLESNQLENKQPKSEIVDMIQDPSGDLFLNNENNYNSNGSNKRGNSDILNGRRNFLDQQEQQSSTKVANNLNTVVASESNIPAMFTLSNHQSTTTSSEEASDMFFQSASLDGAISGITGSSLVDPTSGITDPNQFSSTHDLFNVAMGSSGVSATSPSIDPATMEDTFNISNGMDTSETEAAVADILG